MTDPGGFLFLHSPIIDLWNLAVIDGQIMHGSSRSLLAEKSEGVFRQKASPKRGRLLSI